MGKIKQIIIDLEDKDELDYDQNDNPILDDLWDQWRAQSESAQKLERSLERDHE